MKILTSIVDFFYKSEVKKILSTDIAFIKEYKPSIFNSITERHGSFTSDLIRGYQLEQSDYGIELGISKFGLTYTSKDWKRNNYGLYYWVHFCKNEYGNIIQFGNDELHLFFTRISSNEDASMYIQSVVKH